MSSAFTFRRFSIYRLKHSEELYNIRFKPFEYLQQKGISCNARNYDLMYSGYMRPHEKLEALFYKFNMERPFNVEPSDDFNVNDF
jgi:hypothetical protein